MELGGTRLDLLFRDLERNANVGKFKDSKLGASSWTRTKHLLFPDTAKQMQPEEVTEEVTARDMKAGGDSVGCSAAARESSSTPKTLEESHRSIRIQHCHSSQFCLTYCFVGSKAAGWGDLKE